MKWLWSKIGRWKIVRWLWSIIYKKHLWDDFHKCHRTVIKVKGWRTAIVDSKTQRYTITPCIFPWEKKGFKEWKKAKEEWEKSINQKIFNYSVKSEDTRTI